GPSTVVLDHTSGFEGLLLVDDDLLGVIGHSNFGSIRATTCVYKGKWIYEVLISSQGLMQIGWCTLNCRFNQEEGVGDTPDSYAYDGNRVRKWNVTTTNYGKVSTVLPGREEKAGASCSLDSAGLRGKHLIYASCFSLLLGRLCASTDLYLRGAGHPVTIASCLKQSSISAPCSCGTSSDIHYLRLTIAVLKHEKSRKYLLSNVLFDVLRSVVFFYIKSPLRVEEAGLQELIPTTWWPNRFTKEGKESKEVKEESAEERLRRRAYERGCQRLKKRIEVVEGLQVQILKLLLNNKDRGGGEASRYIFLNKFRKFLQENASNRGPVLMQHPTSLAASLLLRSRKENEPVTGNSCIHSCSGVLCADDLAAKANVLIDPAELQAVTMDDLDEDEESATSAAQRPSATLAIGGALARPGWLSSPTLGRANRFLSTAAVSLMNPRRPLGTLEKVKVRTLSVEQRTEEDIEGSHGNEGLLLGRPPEEPDQPITENSLLEVLDGIVMMYNLSVHQQLGKMVGVSDDVNEYAMALKDTEEKISRCPKRRRDIHEELLKSQKVFSEKLNHLSRRLAWINVTIYSKEKMQDIYWLLRVCIRTIEHGDRTGSLFAFMPEFYLSVAMNSYSALKNYFSPVNSMEELPGYEETLMRLAAILAKHFADSRIVGTDIRDSLMQALASYVCYPHSLRAVERIPEEQRISMMKNLLAPYEQRPWAQTNWILVRLWRGCGFGYRYTRLPHLLKTKPEDASLPSLQKPCPSTLLQRHMADLLRSDRDLAPSFLNSVLNQLNWAFSEFIGMIQEIQQAAERLERNFVDSRQLKVCATCFDLSVSLLRVLEMTVTLAPEIFLDWNRPSSELLLRRLAQLLNQVLNRVTAERNLFDRVVNLRLPGLESVDHYPILVAVTGILVRLLVDTDAQGAERATAVLLADPCFQLRSIQYLLGHAEPAAMAAAAAATEKRHFSLSTYTEYISAEELSKVDKMLSHLNSAAALAPLPPSSAEEDLCPICYAHPISAIFRPCSHKSCKACINQHLMNNKDCFFCKATITGVDDFTKPASS
uniref:RING-type E3 ubiquitin transferase n=1 Tax=Pavo cristatus TaxID=9049 RepID=A0A8C9EWB9_PAVCR